MAQAKPTAAEKRAARREAAAAWEAAQADIPRHDAEFDQKHPGWDEKHGGAR